jgi:transcriptional regulator with XRE-family HTH domain
MMIIRKNMNRLKEARFFSKKPQIKLWIETGIHYSTISRIECGYIQPTEEQKKKLAKAIGVKKDWLFPGEKSK